MALCRGNFYVGGDFNARIHHIREGDADVCGPYIIGRGMEYLNHMNEKTKESRALFLGWCKKHCLTILNSQFSKPLDRLITYKEKLNDSDFGPPFAAERYAQIDYWLTYSDWKSSCTNV